MKPLASLSLDLDNQWSYMKTHGDAGWESFPSYLNLVCPRVLSFLEARRFRITFFVVGQDAALDKNAEAIASLGKAGHEIANHSFRHEPWLHLYSEQELVEEFDRAEAAIESVTGTRTKGFRGPGFSLSPTVLKILAQRGYQYDCSTFPTYIGPLARAYYFLRAPEMSADEREKRKKLFGSFADGLKPLRPHVLHVDDRELVEIPVTTFPGIKTPIHASYLLYLATFSEAAAIGYWRAALAACRLVGIEPSILLHPLDFISGEDVPELKFFPAMSLPSSRKLELLGKIIDLLDRDFEVVTLCRHAATVRSAAESRAEAREVLS
jgi:rhodanese-related sulfurtransferase